jgi:uncharacterized membrane protein YphA (DoxX/SURF4 family)
MSKADLIEAHPESATETIREASRSLATPETGEQPVGLAPVVAAAAVAAVPVVAAVATAPQAPIAEAVEPTVAQAVVEPTVAQAVVDSTVTAAVVTPAAFGEPNMALYRDEDPSEQTRIDAMPVAAVLSDEEAKLAAERAARKRARDEALAGAAPIAPVAPVVAGPRGRSTDKFLPSFGLFLLRLALAAIFGARGLYAVLNISAAQEAFRQTIIPEPNVMAVVVGVSELCIAVALVFGLLTRVAAFGGALIAIGALVLVQWGPWSPFITGRPGFVGELELLIAAACLLLVFTGGGGWGLDHGFRASRAKERDTGEGF